MFLLTFSLCIGYVHGFSKLYLMQVCFFLQNCSVNCFLKISKYINISKDVLIDFRIKILLLTMIGVKEVFMAYSE